MAIRKVPLITGQTYHIYNRSNDYKPIFVNNWSNKRAIFTLSFYRFYKPSVKLSYFLKWSEEKKKQLLDELNQQNNKLIDLICYCLMPNHFHLLLTQLTDGGISRFLSQFQNSYTKYFNTRAKRYGHIFSGQFKAVRIETDEQLLHVSRYIHLNPYSSYTIKNINELDDYPWSSYSLYLGNRNIGCSTNMILSHFKSPKEYKEFVQDQADYQRKLEAIKHLTIEEVS